VNRLLKPLTIAATSVVLATTLTACSSANDEYCDGLKSIKSLNAKKDSAKDPQESIRQFKKVAKLAPKPLKDEWNLLVEATSVVYDTLAASKLTEDQVAQILNGETPEGVPAEDLQALSTTMQDKLAKVDQTKVQQASADIAKDAKKTCDIDMSTE
jgi:hypothetical protein